MPKIPSAGALFLVHAMRYGFQHLDTAETLHSTATGGHLHTGPLLLCLTCNVPNLAICSCLPNHLQMSSSTGIWVSPCHLRSRWHSEVHDCILRRQVFPKAVAAELHTLARGRIWGCAVVQEACMCGKCSIRSFGHVQDQPLQSVSSQASCSILMAGTCPFQMCGCRTPVQDAIIRATDGVRGARRTCNVCWQCLSRLCWRRRQLQNACTATVGHETPQDIHVSCQLSLLSPMTSLLVPYTISESVQSQR